MNLLSEGNPTSPPPPENRPSGILWKFRRLYRAIVVLIFLLAVGHRLLGLGSVPAAHETDDEFFYLWSGISMLHGDQPKAWSFLQVPPRAVIGIFNTPIQSYPIVQPAFDHPPLFQLLTGATGVLARATAFEAPLTQSSIPHTTLWSVSLWKLRLLPLCLFMVSFWSLWGLMRITAGSVAALVTVSVYSFTSVIVMQHRLVVSDNLVTPLVLIALLALEKWRRGRIKSSAAALLTISAVALAVATKLVAICAVAAVFAWAAALLRGRKALIPCLWACAGAVAGIGFIAAFATIFDWEVFVATMKDQAGRFKTFSGLYDLIRRQPTISGAMINEWVMAGYVLLFLGVANTTIAPRGVLCAGIGYAAAYIFFALPSFYGWHQLPFMPFVCAAWGIAFRAAIRRPRAPTTALLMILLAPPLLNLGVQVYPESISWFRYAYMAIAILLLFPWGFRFDSLRKHALRWILAGFLILGLLGEMFHVHVRDVQHLKSPGNAGVPPA